MNHKPVLVLHIKPLTWLVLIIIDGILWFIIIIATWGFWRLMTAIFGG